MKVFFIINVLVLPQRFFEAKVTHIYSNICCTHFIYPDKGH